MTDDFAMGNDVLKILIVDDRAENIASLRQLLARDDMEIISSLSGNEALGLMLDNDFALVLLDVQMPGMDGFEVAELMRRHEKTRTVPIIFVTAINKEQRHIFSGYEAGAMDYLFKPIDPFIIRAKVAAFLELKRSQLARERLVGELNEANARLQQISDLKSDYLSAASHELRTPLTVIKEFCSLVHDEVVGPLNEEQQKCLGSALRNCNRLADLVNDLLDLDSIESGNAHLRRESVAVGELLQACFHDLRGRCSQTGQTLSLVFQGVESSESGASLPKVLAAPDMITQVVVNLVGNALKFTPDGGQITLRGTAGDDGVMVEVRDNGPGISAEDQDRVFEKFAQLNRRDGPGAKGTGLGLPISHKIVELHGGTLELESELGSGCLFRFELPYYCDETHLRAFVSDGTHNPTGLPVAWTLILVRPLLASRQSDERLAEQLLLLARSADDRTGQVTVDGRRLQAVLLKTGKTGALSFLGRLGELTATKLEEVGTLEYAMQNVSKVAAGEPLPDPSNFVFSELKQTSDSQTREVFNRKGTLHV